MLTQRVKFTGDSNSVILAGLRLFLVMFAISFFFADNARHLQCLKDNLLWHQIFTLLHVLCSFSWGSSLWMIWQVGSSDNLQSSLGTCKSIWCVNKIRIISSLLSVLHTWKQVDMFTFLATFLCSSLHTSSSSHWVPAQTWNKSPPKKFLHNNQKFKC